jgi:hypothetical protein
MPLGSIDFMRAFPQLPPRELLFSRFVLIYQMPKIGSQTIEATLRQQGFPYPIRRFHYLSPAISRTVRRGISSARPDPAWKRDAQQQLYWSREVSRSIRLRRIMSSFGFKIPKLEVVTGVRELIGLVLSSTFENYQYFERSIEAMTPDRCRKVLLHPKTFKALRDWFDLELKRFIGIDVFQTPFPKEQGYCVYENRFARVLIYRFDFLSGLPAILQNFLSWDIPALVNSNVGAEKAYAAQYHDARENLRLPKDFVQSLYSDKIMRHFYSETELHRLFQRWTVGPRDRQVQESTAKLGPKAASHHHVPL